MGWQFSVPEEQPHTATARPQLTSDFPESNQISFSGNSPEMARQLSIKSAVKTRQNVLHVQENKQTNEKALRPTDLMLLKSYS